MGLELRFAEINKVTIAALLTLTASPNNATLPLAYAIKGFEFQIGQREGLFRH